MPRTVITPVGTSLRESALCWTGLPRPLNPSHHWRDVTENDRLLSAFRDLRNDLWGRDANEIADRFDRAAWVTPQLPRLSAELASLRLIDEQLQLGAEDEILLVSGCGDSQEPARVLDLVLRTVPWRGTGTPWPRHEPIPGFDADQPEQFVAALSSFNEGITALGDEWECIYNLTGGYKGAAVMLGIAAYVRMTRARPARAFYLFEKSNALIELTVPPPAAGTAPGAPRYPVPRVP